MKSDIEDEDDEDTEDTEDDEDDEDSEGGISLKWALGGVTLFAVLATIVAVALFFGGGDSGQGSASSKEATSAAPSVKVASAHDNGPIAVITEDPSCAAWTSINNSLANDGKGIWNERDRSVPASAWNDKQRAQFSAAGQSMRNAAAQAVGLAQLTPHRVMRELYEQFIAYAREYTNRITKYTPADDKFAGTANSAASALGAICTAITDGSAAARGPLVAAETRPAHTAPPGNPTNPQAFLTVPNPACPEWKSAMADLRSQTAQWHDIDPIIPAILWNQDQKAANYAVAPVINTTASKLEQLGQKSGSPIWQDFADLAAQYGRAFALAVPTYTPTDNHLANAAIFASTTVLGACEVVGG